MFDINDILNSEFMDKIERIHGLKDFLKVKAPDRVEEKAFIHDLNDNPIDCNIYHPKYGYRGFVTDETRHIIASFNPIIYNDPNTNQKVYCSIEPLVILCENENGKLSNKDGVEVKWVSFTLSNQKKLAEDENDFQEILDYWFKEKNLNPEHQEDYTICAEFLINEVTLLQEQHLGHTNRIDKDLNLISLSNRFIKFLKLNHIEKNVITLNNHNILGDTSTRKNKNNDIQLINSLKGTKGFNLDYSDEQLKTLLKALIDGKFLDNQTDEAQFIHAFSQGDLTSFKKLTWLQSKATLSLFIGHLEDDNKWKIAEAIFENCNSRNLAKAFNNSQHIDKHKSKIRLFRKILNS